MKIKKIEETEIQGIKVITPEVFVDERGHFFESFNKNDFFKYGLSANFVQDNQAFSTIGTLRGFHYQLNYAQGKLVRVIQGKVIDVAVDIRQGSRTFGDYFSVILTDENNKIMYIPEGMAHGYLVLSDTAIFQYKCTDVYHPEDEYGILWSDSELNIDWPLSDPILSEKDKNLPTLGKINKKHLPKIN